MEREKRGVLYERCGKCGRLFDLTYELEEAGKNIFEMMQMKMLAFGRLCWKCRSEK